MTLEQKKDACCILLLAIVGTPTHVSSGQDGFLAKLVAKNLIEMETNPLKLNLIRAVFLDNVYPELSTEPIILQSNTDKHCLVALRLLLQRLLQSYSPSEQAWIQQHTQKIYQRLNEDTPESYVFEPGKFIIKTNPEDRVIQDTTLLFTIIRDATNQYGEGLGHAATDLNRRNQTRRIVDNILGHFSDDIPANGEAALVLLLSIVGELKKLHPENSERLASLVANEFFIAPHSSKTYGTSTFIILKPNIFLERAWREIQSSPLLIASSPSEKPLTAIRLLAQYAFEQYNPDEQTILRQRVQATRQNLRNSFAPPLDINALAIGYAAIALGQARIQRERSPSFLGFVFKNGATENLTTDQQHGQSLKQYLRRP